MEIKQEIRKKKTEDLPPRVTCIASHTLRDSARGGGEKKLEDFANHRIAGTGGSKARRRHSRPVNEGRGASASLESAGGRRRSLANVRGRQKICIRPRRERARRAEKRPIRSNGFSMKRDLSNVSKRKNSCEENALEERVPQRKFYGEDLASNA